MVQFITFMIGFFIALLLILFVYRFFDFFYTLYKEDKNSRKNLHKPNLKNDGKNNRNS